MWDQLVMFDKIIAGVTLFILVGAIPFGRWVERLSNDWVVNEQAEYDAACKRLAEELHNTNNLRGD